MNQINQLFSEKKTNLLSIYFTAGFPKLEDTGIILEALQTHGANMIEIGMPYSDPLADGPVIQNSSMKALENGMNIKKLFSQLEKFHSNKPNHLRDITVPLVLMGYLNPVLQYGFEKFCADAKNAGISGIIIPDLPIEVYEESYQNVLNQNNLSFIFLITPETSKERIHKIDSISNGFIYAVSSSSITGGTTNMSAQESYFDRLKQMNLKNEILIGFGIRDHESFTKACNYTAGAIIGTAFINAIENAADVEKATDQFLNSILNGS